jgi:hypothetical protein
MKHYGKTYSPVDREEQQILRGLREWSDEVFAKH